MNSHTGTCLIVHPGADAGMLRSLRQAGSHALVLVCTEAHREAVKNTGVKTLYLPEVWPLDERRSQYARIVSAFSEISRSGAGTVKPYPNRWSYEIDLFRLSPVQYNHAKMEELFWAVLLDRALTPETDACHIVCPKGRARPLEAAAKSRGFGVRTTAAAPERPVHPRPEVRDLKKLWSALQAALLYALLPRKTCRGILVEDSRYARAVIEEFRREDPRLALAFSSVGNEYLARAAWRLNAVLAPAPVFSVRVRHEDIEAARTVLAQGEAVLKRHGCPLDSAPARQWWESLFAERTLNNSAPRLGRVAHNWSTLDRLCPSVCLLEGESGPNHQAAIGWCRGNRATSVLFQHGIQMGGLASPGQEYYQSDYVLEWGSEAARIEATEIGGSAKCIPVGNSRYEKWLARDEASSPRYILVAPSRTEHDWLPDIQDRFWRVVRRLVTEHPEREFLLRPHGLDRRSRTADDALRRILSFPNAVLSPDSEMGEALRKSVLVITTVSTVALDAMVLKRPAVVVNLAGEREGFSNFMPSYVTRDEERTCELVSQLLRDGRSLALAVSEQVRFRELFSGEDHPDSARTIRDLLVSLSRQDAGLR